MELGYSVALFLTSLLMLDNPADLSRIIGGADFLSHEIFTSEEINGALALLEPGGYIEIQPDRQMCATEKAINLCDRTYETAGRTGKVERLLDKLARADIKSPRDPIIFFTGAEVDQAVSDYRRRVENASHLPFSIQERER